MGKLPPFPGIAKSSKALSAQSAANSKSLNHKLERVKGIEPSSQAWEARILPLNHTRCRWPIH